VAKRRRGEGDPKEEKTPVAKQNENEVYISVRLVILTPAKSHCAYVSVN
jgi:hypothetical protein